MAGVMQKFLVASMFMWMLPIAILYGFNNDLLPGILTFFRCSTKCDTSFLYMSLEPSYDFRFDLYKAFDGFLD